MRWQMARGRSLGLQNIVAIVPVPIQIYMTGLTLGGIKMPYTQVLTACSKTICVQNVNWKSNRCTARKTCQKVAKLMGVKSTSFKKRKENAVFAARNYWLSIFMKHYKLCSQCKIGLDTLLWCGWHRNFVPTATKLNLLSLSRKIYQYS